MIKAKTTIGVWALLALSALMLGSGATAEPVALTGPVIAPDGVVHVPAFDLPPSDFMSPEAVKMPRARAGEPWKDPLRKLGIYDFRRALERHLAPAVVATESRYPVNILSQQIGGVRVRVITPKAGEADPRRVLIELHGGGFMVCANACALLDSIPIAAVGRFRVIAVDYREWPEHDFPAASEDVAAVYRDLLKRYRPREIGIYGCSAGGILAGEVESWFQKKGLPSPGALGMFGASGILFRNGDSPYVTGYIDGSFMPPAPGKLAIPTAYFGRAKLDSPLISPAAYPKVLARFPPTLLITGTRAHELSGAVYTHTQLVKAGAKGDLIVGEGMGHCYLYFSALPEARDAYGIIVRFFDDHLAQ